MTVADDVTLDDLILAKDDLSGADIKVSQTGLAFRNAHFGEVCWNSLSLNITYWTDETASLLHGASCRLSGLCRPLVASIRTTARAVKWQLL